MSRNTHESQTPGALSAPSAMTHCILHPSGRSCVSTTVKLGFQAIDFMPADALGSFFDPNWRPFSSLPSSFVGRSSG